MNNKIILLTESFSFACLNTAGAWFVSPPAAEKSKKDLRVKDNNNKHFHLVHLLDQLNALKLLCKANTLWITLSELYADIYLPVKISAFILLEVKWYSMCFEQNVILYSCSQKSIN